MHLEPVLKFLTSVNRVGLSCLTLPLRQKARTYWQCSFRNVPTIYSTSSNFVNRTSPMGNSCKKCISFDKEYNVAQYLIFIRSKSTDVKKQKIMNKIDNLENKKPERVKIKLVKEADTVQLFSVDELFIGNRTLNEAREFAKQEGMRLVKLQGKTGSNIPPSYKLMSKAMKVNEPKKEKKENIKQFVIKGGIDEHDLDTKIGQMIKLLTKGTTVQIKFKDGKMKGSPAPLLKKIGEQLDHVAYTKSSTLSPNSKDHLVVVFVPRENVNQDIKDDS